MLDGQGRVLHHMGGRAGRRRRLPRRRGGRARRAARLPAEDGLLVQGRAPRRDGRAGGALARRPGGAGGARRGRRAAARGRRAARRRRVRPSHPRPRRRRPRRAPRGAWREWWHRLTDAGARPAGTVAYEALRVEAVLPRAGLDTDDRTIPHEVGWIGAAVHLSKGCYRGQETVARVANMGRAPRRLVLLHLDAGDEQPARPRRAGHAGGPRGGPGRHGRAAPRARARGAGVGEALGAARRGAHRGRRHPGPHRPDVGPPPRRPPPAAAPPRSACAGADPRPFVDSGDPSRHTSGATSHIGRRARYGRWQDTDEMRTGPPRHPAAPSLL